MKSLLSLSFQNLPFSVNSVAEYFALKEFPRHEFRTWQEKTSFEAVSRRILKMRKKKSGIKTRSYSSAGRWKTLGTRLAKRILIYLFKKTKHITATYLKASSPHFTRRLSRAGEKKVILMLKRNLKLFQEELINDKSVWVTENFEE